VVPSLAASSDTVFKVQSHRTVLGCDQPHALQFGQQILALEDSFPVYVYPPLALWLSSIGCIGGCSILELRLGLGLVKVPPQRRPEHHGDLARRTRWRAELMAAGIAYTADEEVVVLQGRALEAVDVLLFRGAQRWYRAFRLMGMIRVELRVCCC
jgi:hypothetical protein